MLQGISFFLSRRILVIKFQWLKSLFNFSTNRWVDPHDVTTKSVSKWLSTSRAYRGNITEYSTSISSGYWWWRRWCDRSSRYCQRVISCLWIIWGDNLCVSSTRWFLWEARSLAKWIRWLTPNRVNWTNWKGNGYWWTSHNSRGIWVVVVDRLVKQFESCLQVWFGAGGGTSSHTFS